MALGTRILFSDSPLNNIQFANICNISLIRTDCDFYILNRTLHSVPQLSRHPECYLCSCEPLHADSPQSAIAVVILCLLFSVFVACANQGDWSFTGEENSLPAFGFKCIKCKKTFSNPDGIPFWVYFSEVNKVFYPEPSKPLSPPLPWAGLADSLAKKVMAFNRNTGP